MMTGDIEQKNEQIMIQKVESAISDLNRSVDTKDNDLLYSAFGRLREYSEFSWKATFELGKLYFEGRYISGDLKKALDFFIRAKELGGNYDVDVYLNYFLGSRTDEISGREEEDSSDRPIRASGALSVRQYNFPDDGLAGSWEWTLLQWVTDTDYYSGYCCGDGVNKYGGFSNGTFFMRPYSYYDDRVESVIAHFRYEPTGFEIEVYKYFFRDSYMNEKLNASQICAVWVKCIDSVLKDNAEKFRASDFGIRGAI